MTAPFLIRLVKGDITRVQSSMLVVSHFNGVNPVGAQAAVDQAMGGAITRRAASGAINGRFASTHFLPAATSSLAAGSVLVVGLGDPERFVLDRLPEVGAAIVDAVATFRLRDAATTLHSTGSTGIDHERAARLLVGGVLEALRSLPGAGCFRELVIVERDATKLAKIERGLRAAASAPDLHVYVDHDEVPSPPLPVTSA
ncbi:MAG TPA: M17 family peptidase N-terminal domain-containing protein, partial [Acidimicrobiales bacterium]|nr:M17 family peptidase N-terminal domain-containing protein [Acidimicrobiales bacterium]